MSGTGPLQRRLDAEVRLVVEARRRQGLLGTISQSEIDGLADRWRPLTRSAEGPGSEILDLAGPEGTPLGPVAPRWLCHLLGLRHRSVHILLDWTSPDGRHLLVLQIRSMSKASYPGCLDISVGGHVPAGVSTEAAALDEMQQELGLQPAHLLGDAVRPVASFESCTVAVEDCRYDREWCDVFTGTVADADLEAVRFPDGEVAGGQLLPVTDAATRLTQGDWPVAPGLAHSLPHCLPVV